MTGPADIIGPDELPESMDVETLRVLLHNVFQAAGGTHDDYRCSSHPASLPGTVGVQR